MSTISVANRQWLTLAQAADHLGFTVPGLRKMIARGDLPAYRSPGGRALRVKLEDVDAVLSPVPTAREAS